MSFKLVSILHLYWIYITRSHGSVRVL